MAENTEDKDEGTGESVFDYVPSAAFQIGDGEYIIFPEGMKKFADKYRAEAISIESDGDIMVLRTGPKKDQLRWVSLVAEDIVYTT
jgi:hypothetical protein